VAVVHQQQCRGRAASSGSYQFLPKEICKQPGRCFVVECRNQCTLDLCRKGPRARSRPLSARKPIGRGQPLQRQRAAAAPSRGEARALRYPWRGRAGRHLQVALVVLRGCLRIQLLFVCNVLLAAGQFQLLRRLTVGGAAAASLLPDRERRSTAHTPYSQCQAAAAAQQPAQQQQACDSEQYEACPRDPPAALCQRSAGSG
jgi:hypothetical protein